MVNISTKAHSVTKIPRKFTDAELAAAERCTCRPQDDAYLCISCRERNRRKYGENIAFFVDGKEVVE
jgi:hypothetical protein